MDLALKTTESLKSGLSRQLLAGACLTVILLFMASGNLAVIKLLS